MAYSDNSLTGVWEGIYFQDNLGVRFKMTLNDSDGVINGDCNDFYTDGGNPEAATISGFIMGNLVSLIKSYSCLWYYDDRGNIVREENKKHPEIRYNGRIKKNKIKPGICIRKSITY